MTRLLPPPHLLRALVAMARHASITRSADELHLTPGAVSKQLADLESRIDVALFERQCRRLALTEAGRHYAERVAKVLDELERATLDVQAGRRQAAASGKQRLQLSVLPSIGERWLIPRLPDFLARHPQVELHFVHFSQGYDFSHPELDAAIRYGTGDWPGARCDDLIGHEAVVIAPPHGKLRLKKPADVLKGPLVQHARQPQAWATWLRAHKLPTAGTGDGPVMDQMATYIRAVASGLGLGLVPQFLVRDEVASGQVLLAPFAPYRQKNSYWLCVNEARADRPAVRALRQWLVAQAHADARG